MCDLKYRLYLWEDIPHLHLDILKYNNDTNKIEQSSESGIIIESLKHIFAVKYLC